MGTKKVNKLRSFLSELQSQNILMLVGKIIIN